ncbi:M56 family metallopeptidase [Mucilaginibacter sp. OK283]|uniref:M56 family metallopeptidase n=1 Tax=Mucilaginibacter sp. OK283 TaxID=1881049 RepID=UPI0008B7DAB9|nr:M56 family metallopeptidase [Mucilaginibacter sp. OK283]SEP14337.1 Signal transducer regulating beta-lactamase production, contains metallopeptidase domain [Mucilaginibacter sp. OK283]
MTYLNELLPQGFTTALSYTLLHSLWQGVILAVITSLILVFTRRQTAAKRYTLMVGALMLFALTAIGTFIWEINQTAAGKISPASYSSNNQTPQAPVLGVAGFTQDSVIDKGINYVNTHAQLIVLIWFLVVFARGLQLSAGLQGLHHLRRRSVFTVDEYWKERVALLSQKLGIKQIIGIAESGIAKVPMVIGHLKPLILIPVGLLTALPPAEVEAILVHELAHIRRRDYLINLLQSFIEIIFFFNPAVLWLSALIRTERENCCDDIAVLETSSKVNYIRALVSCQEFQLSAPAYAMAFPGKRDQLINRVKRMASGNNHSLNIRERSVLAVLLLSAGLLTMAFSNVKRIDKMLLNTGKTVSHAVVSVKKELFHADDTSSHHADLKPGDVNKEAKITHAASLKATAPISADTPAKAKPLDTLKSKLGRLHGGLGTLSKLDEQKELAKADSINQSRTQNTKPTAPAQNAYSYGSKPYNKQDYKSVYKADYKPYHAPTEPSIGEVVTAELKKDGLIDADAPKVSFKLSQSEMIINGVKQPDDVFQKYKKKYVPVTGKNQWTLYNNYDTDTKVTTTDKP